MENETKSKLEALAGERESLWTTIRPMQDRLRVIADEMERLRTERDKAAIAAGETDWKQMVVALGASGDGSMALLQHFDRLLASTFDMSHSQYWTDTGEAEIEIKIRRGDARSEALNLAGVRHFLGILAPHEDGMVWFGVFEHTLAASGSYCLAIAPDGSRALLRRGRREIEIAEFHSIEEAIRYLATHHWYGDCESSGDDEE